MQLDRMALQLMSPLESQEDTGQISIQEVSLAQNLFGGRDTDQVLAAVVGSWKIATQEKWFEGFFLRVSGRSVLKKGVLVAMPLLLVAMLLLNGARNARWNALDACNAAPHERTGCIGGRAQKTSGR